MRRLKPTLFALTVVALAGTGCDGTNALLQGKQDTGTGGTPAGDTGVGGGSGDTGITADIGPRNDGSVTPPDGRVNPPDGFVPPDGSVNPNKDGTAPQPDALVPPPDGSVVVTPDGSVVVTPDGSVVVTPDGGGQPVPDAFVPLADAWVPPTPDAFAPPPDGPIIVPPECLPGDQRPCAVPTCAGGIQTCDGTGTFGVYIGPAETCDGLDNDCDGLVDNGFANLGQACVTGTGACASTGIYICGAGGQTVQCSAVPGTPNFEVCDGVDNDCNGTVDDAFDGTPIQADCYTGSLATEGVGTCAAGVMLCTNGAFGECLGQVLPIDEICNGEDDDCNGFADDGPGGAQLSEACYDGPAGTAGVGNCLAGVSVCSAGQLGACQHEVLPQREVCDQIDNDCNGVVDDTQGISCDCNPGDSRACYTGPDGTQGVGACAAGTQACADNGRFAACQGETLPSNEFCDGVDNDCNGQVDDGLRGLGVACSNGLGECGRDGVTVCDSNAGAVVCDAVPAQPLPERCDGLDNDCNGLTDEGLGLGDACDVGRGACVAAGVLICGDNGNTVCSAHPGAPVAELCDGIDNDCNGVVDNGLRLGDVCTLGTGACMAQGVFQCGANGSVVCSAVPSSPTPEACDGIDNDCYGVVDNGNPGGGQLCDTGLAGVCGEGSRMCVNGAYECQQVTQPGVERCDGRDNDCDGLTDEDDAGDPLARQCYDGPGGTAGIGQCRAGVQTCDQGLYGSCVGQVLPVPEICDLADNNCNGRVDDGLAGQCVCAPGTSRACYSGAAGTQDVGACHSGSQACSADGSGWGACAGEGVPSGETCNGIDDDCNGTVDDAPGVGLDCGSGTGACFAAGHLQCNADRGLLECSAVGRDPTPEVCDGIDNDCDGGVDNVAGFGDNCSDGVGACLRTGNRVCDVVNHVLVCSAVRGQPSAEVCDGQDNNCDGTVDNNVPGLGNACNPGIGACQRRGVTVCQGGAGIQCSVQAGQPSPELCNGRDDDCNAVVDDNPVDAGGDCSAGVGACFSPGVVQCTNGQTSCTARPGAPTFEICDGLDNNCDGQVDENPACLVFASCLRAWAAGYHTSGIYRIGTDAAFNEVYCDQASDGGGWTLVGSTRAATLNDQRSDWYDDLRTLAPAAGHDGVWGGLRGLNRQNYDVRFACRAAAGGQAATMDVDMSFYNTIWYGEWTTGTDAQSCFSENQGAGYDGGTARRNNLNRTYLPQGTNWLGTDLRQITRYLEGEDSCDDTGDFTVDFQDRGMDSNEVDGTDWGEDDSLKKCGNRNDAADGQWFVFAREAGAPTPARVPSFVVGAGAAQPWNNVTSVSCVEECAALNGGSPEEFYCSTNPQALNRRAYLDGFNDPRYCADPGAEDTYKLGGPYNCGRQGCSYTAYVNDHQACRQRVNYCWHRTL